jgi:Indole-3-glycerol phosphate synthase
MSDILAKIGSYKREEIAAAKRLRPLATLESEAKGRRCAARLLAGDRAAAHGRRVCLDRRSQKGEPSRGLIRDDFDPPALAAAYAQGGATCLSVLTDTPSFQGSLDHLRAARAACPLPRCARISCTTPIR